MNEVKEKEVKSNTDKQLKYERIDKSSDNFKKIIDKQNNDKFEYLDTWLYKTSNIFKKENSKNYKNVYPRFRYGTIVKVDFGINQGSEISGPHFAITLEKFDSTKNSIITVLPLTSKDKGLNLPLNELIVEEFTKKLKKSVVNLKEEIKILRINRPKNLIDEAKRKQDELKLIIKMIDYYSNYAKNSYACINQITTISKNKIIAPKNKFDIIGRSRCSSKTMKLISTEILKKYTNLYYKVEEITDKV